MARDWNAEAVRRLREQLGVTQAELADRIGTRQQTISEWETGSSAPRRMSQRLLRMVAEEAGTYDAGHLRRRHTRASSSASTPGGPTSRAAPTRSTRAVI